MGRKKNRKDSADKTLEKMGISEPNTPETGEPDFNKHPITFTDDDPNNFGAPHVDEPKEILTKDENKKEETYKNTADKPYAPETDESKIDLPDMPYQDELKKFTNDGLAEGERIGTCVKCDVAFKGDNFWVKLDDNPDDVSVYVTATEGIRMGDKVIISKDNKARKA